ncbi:MAG: insulinase family protein [Burkholderiaceae bacterium]|nr:insulinase family protein [Burkholderiaceae bacterium]
MKRRHLLGLGTGAVGAGLWLPTGGLWAATPGVDAPPEPQPPRPVLMPALHTQRLDNGLTVITAPRHDLPLVSAVLVLRAGSENDPAGRPGVAAMTATLLAKGARRGGRAIDASTLARQAEALGSALDTASGQRSLSLAMTVARPSLEAALALMADVLRTPLLDAGELERARAQALDGLRLTLNDPGALAGLVLRRCHWGPTPHGAVDAPASLQRLGVADVRGFHARWVRPELCALVLAGDVTPAQAQGLARQLLGGWRGAGALPEPPRLQPPQPLAERLVLVDLPGAGQSGVAVAAPFVAQRGPLAEADGRAEADAPPSEQRIGQVAAAVLGGGYSARLNQEVRIKRGLSYGASASAESTPVGGMLQAQTQTDHRTAAEVLGLLRSEIGRLATAAPTPAELAARQATLVGGFARRLETSGGVAGMLLAQWVNQRPLAELQRSVPEILAVTPEQVAAFAARHWREPGLRAVVVGQLEAAGSALTGEAGARRLPATALDLEAPNLVAEAAKR